MKRFTGVLCTVVGGILIAGAGQAFAAATRTVGNDSLACPKAQFSTIQAAVNASGSGDRIRVCPGTYTEQVSIPAGKKNLTLESMQHRLGVIQAPASMTTPMAIVRVNGAHNATIRGFTIQGPGGGGCGSIEFGVRVDAGGSATIQDNHIAHIRDNPFSGCQNGVGIQIGRAADSTSGTATIKKNLIDDYQKNGITISGPGSSASVVSNTVTGAGPTAVTAQNGVQVSSGAAAVVKRNTVSGDRYSPQTTSATGILLFGPVGHVVVSTNTLSGDDTGIYAFGADLHTSITSNHVSGSTWDGITLDSSVGPIVNMNTTDSGDQGIGVYGTSHAQILGNHASGNASNGFYAGSDSSANMFQSNVASGSGLKDCRDDSTGTVTFGTANAWKKNVGASSSPANICKP